MLRFGRKFSRHIDGGDHTVGPRDSFAGDGKGRAVVGAGPRKWQAKGHVHAAMKGVQFQRDQSLIVIHAEGGIPLLVGKVMEQCVRRDRSIEKCS